MNFIVEYPGSALLYISVVLCAALLARFVGRSGKRDNAVMLLILLLLSIISGIRAPSVGLDTAGYIRDTFSVLSAGKFSAAYGEIGFKLICRVLLFISGENVNFALFGLAFLTHGLALLRYKDFKDDHSYSTMVLIYLCLNFLPAMNGMAQYLASSVIFWSTRYLKKGKYFSFIFGIAIAATIHATSIIGVLFLFIYLLAQGKMRKRQKIALTVFVLLLPVLGVLAYRYLMQYTKFARYFETYMSNRATNVDVGLMIPATVLVISGILLLLVISKKRAYSLGQSDSHNSEIICACICLIGTALQGLGIFYTYLYRLAMSFMFFEPVLASRKLQNSKLTLMWLLRALLIFAAVYTFYVQLSGNGSRTMPFLID